MKPPDLDLPRLSRAPAAKLSEVVTAITRASVCRLPFFARPFCNENVKLIFCQNFEEIARLTYGRGMRIMKTN